jgi:WD40 repeat protein
MRTKRIVICFVCLFILSPFIIGQTVDLIKKAPEARWLNGENLELRFGEDGRQAGMVKFEADAVLEDGKTYKQVLFTHPAWTKGGSVNGFYRAVTIPANGGKIVVAGGFMKGADRSDGVMFTVYFMKEDALLAARGVRQESGTRIPFGSFQARYDGKIDSYEYDLEKAAGMTGYLVLHVNAGLTADSDWAVWTEASMMFGAQTAAQKKTIQEATRPVLLHTLSGHSNRIYSASFSPNGRYVVTASGDKSAKVWDAKSGQLVLNLGNHPSHVFCADFSPNSRSLATVSGNDAKIWGLPGGQLIQTLSGHTGKVSSVRFNEGGNRVITTSEDGSAKIWDVSSGQIHKSIQITNKGWAYSADFHPRGGSVVIGAHGGQLGIYDVNSGAKQSDLRGHSRAINLIRFNKTGSRMVSASVDNSIKIWDIPSGRLIRTIGGRTFDSGDFSPDDKFVVTGNDGGKAIIWDVSNGNQVMLLNHAPGGRVMIARFSPDGRYVVTAGENNVAKIWEVILP